MRHVGMDRNRLSRRAVLAGAGGALSVAAAGSSRAQAAPGIHHFTAGAAELTVLSDGVLDIPMAVMLPDQAPAAVDALFKSTGRTPSGLTAQINVVLIKLGVHVILVDSGGGPDFMPGLGRLAGPRTKQKYHPRASSGFSSKFHFQTS